MNRLTHLSPGRSLCKRERRIAHLMDGARKTPTDGFAVVEDWMIPTTPPTQVGQWDKKSFYKDKSHTSMSFYCWDTSFNRLLDFPDDYLEELRQYESIIGPDASPYDNMPLWFQKNQIGLNLALTHFFGRHGIKVIPNVRLGDIRTCSSLEAYPQHTLIAIGTHGFIKSRNNHDIFETEVQKIVDTLLPTGIIVYGSAPDWLFPPLFTDGIPIYQYPSFLEKRGQ